MIAILHAIERHTASLSSQPRLQDEADFLARYRHHVVEYHGQIEPPDFERRRRIPIAHIYVAPSIIQMADVQEPEQLREIDLLALADEVDRTVLLGDPGSGKTTSVNVLMHFHAAEEQRRLPFIVTLREFAAADPPERSVVGFIEHRLEVFYQCPAPARLLARLLLTGAAIVIFDGLDELLDTAHRADVAAVVERFCTEYPLVPVLVTSRLVGYDQARLDDRQFGRYRIRGFGEDQVRDYVTKWFAQDLSVADEAPTWTEAFMTESANVPDLRSSPLMLALMCILYRGEASLPRNRAEVYEQCASLLFRKWDARRRIHRELKAGHLVEPAIRHLAWWLLNRDSAESAVTQYELINEVTRFFEGRGFELEIDARAAASEFVDFCTGRMWVLTDTGTTASGEVLYSFTHRTFLEFFAAAHLAYSCDTPERLARTLAPRLARHEWEVVGELAVQVKDHSSDQGAQRIYTALLGERRRRSSSGRSGVLQFLARCLSSSSPSPRTVRELTRAVLDHLFAETPRDPLSYLPTAWLLASCTTCREVVSDEIAKRISVMIESPDPSVHLNGLRLAAWLPYASWGTADASKPPTNPSLAKFWREHAAEMTHEYANSIVAAANDSTEMRFAGLHWDVLTPDQAIEMPGGLLPLFEIQETGIFAINWASRLVGSVVNLCCYSSYGSFDPDDKYVSGMLDDFAAVGRYLMNHPSPPWVKGLPQSWSGFSIWDDEPDEPEGFPIPRLDPVAYLGAATTLLIATEGIEEAEPKLLPSRGPEQFGVLRDLYYYIAKRWNAEAEIELHELPVPDAFDLVFKDWATGRVNFAAPNPE
jgi:hypothetical protein